MNTIKPPQRLVTVENGVRVERMYPTFARAWDAHYDAAAAGHKVITRHPVTEADYQSWLAWMKEQRSA